MSRIHHIHVQKCRECNRILGLSFCTTKEGFGNNKVIFPTEERVHILVKDKCKREAIIGDGVGRELIVCGRNEL